MEAALILKILNMIQAGFSFLASRGMAQDRAQAIIDEAGDEDVSSDQVQAELDLLQSELDDTDVAIDDMGENGGPE